MQTFSKIFSKKYQIKKINGHIKAKSPGNLSGEIDTSSIEMGKSEKPIVLKKTVQRHDLPEQLCHLGEKLLPK